MKTVELLKQAQFHGAKRIAMSRNKYLWATTFLTLLCCSVIVQFNTIQRYISNPTYIMQKESILNLKPFPNVLIFPQINFVEEKIDVFLNELDYPGSLNFSYVKSVLNQLAAFLSPDVDYNLRDLKNIQHLLDHNNLDVETVGKRLTASCDEILLRCRWREAIVNCSKIFLMEITRTGYSCVFNGRSLKREIQEFGMHRVKPGRDVNVSSVGFSNSLMVVVDQKETILKDIDLDYKWVALQAGQHYIDVGVNGTPINPGMELWVGYVTRSVQASGDALSLSSNLRKCQLADAPLDFFPIYHKSYCLLECEIKRTIRKCHCTKISYPRIAEVPLCRAEQLQCAREITVSYQLGECHCPTTCNVDVDFLIPQTSAYYLNSSYYSLDTLYDGLDFDHVSVVRVYISAHNKKINQRKSYFTNYDLFSQIGGVLCLFFGCSILTSLELGMLMYRWLKELRKNKKIKEKKEKKHQKNKISSKVNFKKEIPKRKTK